MQVTNFGNNIVRALNLNQKGKQEISKGNYQYYFYHFTEATKLLINELASFTVYLLEAQEEVTCALADGSFVLDKPGDCLQSENREVTLQIRGKASFLVAGTSEPALAMPPGVSKKKESELYRVEKPWGYEIWLTGSDHPTYCFKKIKINQGTKTSLQYHEIKQETILILEGKAKLYYKQDAHVLNRQVEALHIGVAPVQTNVAIDIPPGTLHRVESISDILVFEVSTPHFDDVIRIQDDSQRKDGRIKEEHVSNPSVQAVQEN